MKSASLKKQLLIVTLASIILTSILLIGVSLYIFKNDAENSLKIAESEQKDDYEYIIQSREKGFFKQLEQTMAANARVAGMFSGNQKILDVYEALGNLDIYDETSQVAKDARSSIKSVTNKMIETMAYKNKNIVKIHYHTRNAKSLARTWRSDWQTKKDGKKVDISDDLSSFRKSVLAVNSQKKDILGVEVGRSGLAIRSLTPLNNEEGDHLGSVEAFSSFNDLFNELRFDKSEHIAVFLKKNYLKIATKLKDTKIYPIIDNKYSLINYSSKKHFTDIFKSAQDLDVTSSKQKIIGDRMVNIIPIKDFSGNIVASLVYSFDYSTEIDLLDMKKEEVGVV